MITINGRYLNHFYLYAIQLYGDNRTVSLRFEIFLDKKMASGKARLKKKVLDTSKLYEVTVHEDPRKVHFIRL